MIILTGGAGFIGSNLILALNAQGRSDILVVDDLTDGTKCRNLAGLDIADYLDKDEFVDKLCLFDRVNDGIDVLFHLGACSTTTERDGRYMMRNNYAYSRTLLEFCVERRIPFVYASSAAVYGNGVDFRETSTSTVPLNVYGYSKLLFDQYVCRRLASFDSQIVGLRYFNVYGPREHHKGAMASVIYQFSRQLVVEGCIRLFQGSGGYADGEQRRDFVYVDDVSAVTLWFMGHSQISGIFNVGTGRSQSFNEVAEGVIRHHGRGSIEYIPFPKHLSCHYQSFTQADISALRNAGYRGRLGSLEEGMSKYLEWLQASGLAGERCTAKHDMAKGTTSRPLA